MLRGVDLPTLGQEGKINIHMDGFLEAGFEPGILEFVSDF